MFQVKVPLFYLIIISILGSGFTTGVFYYFSNKLNTTSSQLVSGIGSNGNFCDHSTLRLQGYEFVKPLLIEEPECESPLFIPLKNNMLDFIQNEHATGELSYVSVFLRDINTSNWMIINPEQGYHPGSLIKMAVLITYLKMAENKPGLLENVINYDHDNQVYPTANFKSDTIQLGQNYSIRKLLKYMIQYSDNRATVALERLMDMNVFRKTFSDIGLKELNFSDTTYRVSVKPYSKFLIELYNAAYLTVTSSEYAASLLAESNFMDGLKKMLPKDVKVVHKFGEWGDGQQYELHESGIIYLNNKPYLLTIMTCGKNFPELSKVLGELSKMTYDFMADNKA